MFYIVVLLLLLQLITPSYAAKSGITDSPKAQDKLFTPPDSVTFAQIPTDAPEVILVVEGVKATVRRVPGISVISVSSNCPARWYTAKNIIRQVAALNMPKGVSVRADSAGAVALVNGKVYALPSGSGGQIRGLSIKDGEVVINGQSVKPLPGSDKAGSCTGPDVLDVQVPDSYAGDLKIAINGNSDVKIDSWKGGAIQANVSNNGSLSAGKLDNLSKAVFDVQGGGKAHVNDVTTKTLVVNVVGDGTITIDRGSSDISNATISGTGKITLHGKYRNLEKAVSGQGAIEVLD